MLPLEVALVHQTKVLSLGGDINETELPYGSRYEANILCNDAVQFESRNPPPAVRAAKTKVGTQPPPKSRKGTPAFKSAGGAIKSTLQISLPHNTQYKM